jgi:ligand-binding SRPBCC domain-containing protein
MILIENACTIAAAPEVVFAHLSDPANYVGLSPLVVAVRDVSTDADGVTRYRAVERFGLPAGLRYDNVIAVTLTASPDDRTISGDVVSPGWVRLACRYVIEPADGGTRLTDELRLRAPVGLRTFARGRAREVQLARAKILAERLASS